MKFPEKNSILYGIEINFYFNVFSGRFTITRHRDKIVLDIFENLTIIYPETSPAQKFHIGWNSILSENYEKLSEQDLSNIIDRFEKLAIYQ